MEMFLDFIKFVLMAVLAIIVLSLFVGITIIVDAIFMTSPLYATLLVISGIAIYFINKKIINNSSKEETE